MDCAHLTSTTGGQLCALVAYDSNMHIMPMCFALFRTETADNWQRFMSNVFRHFPHFATIISDGAKGLASLSDMFRANDVVHGRCAWHILEKNADQQSFKITRSDLLLISALRDSLPLCLFCSSHSID